MTDKQKQWIGVGVIIGSLMAAGAILLDMIKMIRQEDREDQERANAQTKRKDSTSD